MTAGSANERYSVDDLIGVQAKQVHVLEKNHERTTKSCHRYRRVTRYWC